MMQSGGAILEASDIVIERGKQLAAEFLEAGVSDIEFARGRFNVAGTDLSIGILRPRRPRARLSRDLPEDLPRTLDVKHIFKGVPSAFSGTEMPHRGSRTGPRNRHHRGRQLRDRK